jgi:hypothetical protein
MSLLASVTESTQAPLHRRLILQVVERLLVLLSESLWAPEADDTYESSILAASPSVQPISFPELQDISLIRLSYGPPSPHTLLKSRAGG